MCALSVLLAIDPGRCTGWCVAVDGKIKDCGVYDFDPWGQRFTFLSHPIYQPDLVVIEYPQVYRGRHSKGDPNDLIPVAGQAWATASFHQSTDHARVELVLPAQWKGQLDKDVHHPRLFSQPYRQDWGLDHEEQITVAKGGRGLPKSRLHNMLDAVCLAVWAGKRYLKGR